MKKKFPRVQYTHIIVGRRNCNHCKRWRHVLDFGVRTWWDKEKTVPRYFYARCRTCERQRGRIKNARMAGRDRPYGRREFPDVRPEARRARARAGDRRRRQSAEYRDNLREYQRIWTNSQRREQGVPKRNTRKPLPASNGYRSTNNTDIKLPLEPFAKWVLEGYRGSTSQLARAMGVDEARVRRYAKGFSYGSNGKVYLVTDVTINFVDKALVKSGSGLHLWDLYPEEEYPDLYTWD